jgi:hypothetical protein
VHVRGGEVYVLVVDAVADALLGYDGAKRTARIHFLGAKRKIPMVMMRVTKGR